MRNLSVSRLRILLYLISFSFISFAAYSQSVSISVLPSDTICEGDSVQLSACCGLSYLWSTGHTTSSISLAPNVTTTYSVTVIDSLSNTASDSVTIVVHPLPSVMAFGKPEGCPSDIVPMWAEGANAYLWSNGSTNDTVYITLLSDTTLFVTGTDSKGCSASDSFFCDMGNVSQTLAMATDSIICLGDSVTLSATGSGSFLGWNDDMGPIPFSNSNPFTHTPTYSSNYAAVYFSNSECIEAISAFVAVDSTNSPPVIMASGDTLIATPGFVSYTWFLNGIVQAETSNVFLPPTNGTVMVEATSAGGCLLSSDIFLGENEPIAASLQVDLFPNPAPSQVTVRIWSGKPEPFQIQLVDLAGRSLQTKQFRLRKGNNLIHLETGGLAAGVYLISMQGGDLRETHRLLIE